MTNQSGTIDIPIRAGEILDQAFRLYRQHFLDFALAVAIFQVPAQLISLGSSLYSEFNLDQIRTNLNQNTGATYMPNFTSILLLSFGLGLLTIILNWYGTALLTRLAGQAYFSKTANIGLAFRSIGRRWLTLALAVVAVVFVGWLAIVFTLVPCVGWLLGPGIAVFMLVMVLPLMSPIVVFEGNGINHSFRRAVYLIRQKFWWVFGYIIALAMLQFILATLPAALLQLGISGVLENMVGSGRNFFILTQASSVLTSLFATIVVTPLTVSAGFVLYLSLRAQVEGLDLVLMSAAQETPPELMVEVLGQDVPKPIGGNNRQLFANYVIISLIGIGLYLLLVVVLQVSVSNFQ
jgi:hypothetical protein